MERNKESIKASIYAIIGNIFLLIIKGIIGFITNSQAMISDALNSAGDIISSAMGYIGNKISSKEPDEDHNLGHGKAEYIFSMFISMITIILSFEVLISSIKSLFIKQSYYPSIGLIVVCIITIITKLVLFIYTKNIGKKYKNILVEASAIDHRNDIVLTSLNLIASIFGLYGITFVDGLIGSVISLWILNVGIGLFKESYDILMDKSNNKVKDEVINVVNKFKDVKKINHINLTPVGYQYQVSLSIFVDGNLSTYKSHEIANNIEKELNKLEDIYLAIIHVNPIELDKKTIKFTNKKS